MMMKQFIEVQKPAAAETIVETVINDLCLAGAFARGGRGGAAGRGGLA